MHLMLLPTPTLLLAVLVLTTHRVDANLFETVQREGGIQPPQP